MTPGQIRADAKEAGLPDDLDYPTESVAGLEIDSGDRARAFAGYAIGGALRNPETVLGFLAKPGAKVAPAA